ncbi:MAG: hypothetical protein O3A47_08075 [Chloroflexi bacterium]|nr:hypothetical protein [Chloroflexota bacterium]
MNKKAAARALAGADLDVERWRTLVRRIVRRRETSEDESLFTPEILAEIIDAIRGIGHDGEAWFNKHLETSLGIEKQEFADDWGGSDWKIWKLLNRVTPELAGNKRAYADLLTWLKDVTDRHGSEAAHRELARVIERVQPLWAHLSDSDQRKTLTKALEQGSGWLSLEAKAASRTSIVAKRRHGQPTCEELAVLQKEEEAAYLAVKGGAELLDRRGDGGMTWTELLSRKTDVESEEIGSKRPVLRLAEPH